jgi:hypothetical protein
LRLRAESIFPAHSLKPHIIVDHASFTPHS